MLKKENQLTYAQHAGKSHADDREVWIKEFVDFPGWDPDARDIEHEVQQESDEFFSGDSRAESKSVYSVIQLDR